MISYFKGQSNEYILKYSAGRLKREGAGISFFYLRYHTQIVIVPTGSQDVNFVFNEVTNNFQEVTFQGQLTYRIQNPSKAAALLNFTIDPYKRTYTTSDPEKIGRRISNIIQIETRNEIQQRTLEESLRDSQTIGTRVLERSKSNPELQTLGVELLNVYFLSTRPTPEVAKALEADYREMLLRKADEAIYARRASAVDEERKIKEKELASDRLLEEQRKELILLQGANAKQEAQNRGEALELEASYRAKASEMELTVLKNVEPRSLLAIAMKQLGENAGNINNLTITTEMLSSLLNTGSNVER
jgi:regulator of protease activity HflC (stomatin/prohibitin superfamily)